MHSSIQLPAGFTVLGADGTFFSVTHGLELRHGHPEGLQLSFDGLCTSFSKDHIVRIRAPVITMAFNYHGMVRLGLDNGGGGFERRPGITADRILIEIEVHVVVIRRH